MAIDSRGYVSVAELIVYVPALVLAAIVCFRHGIRKTSGWIYTLLLCLIRIIGAICQLATYSNKSTDLITATLIIDAIGLSPLLFATLGLLSRLVDFINSSRMPILKPAHFRLIQLLIMIGLILGIAGGASGSSSSTGHKTPTSTSQAGIILYIIAFAAIVGVLLLAFGSLSYVPPQEKRVAAGVTIALPLILIRLVYSAVSVFANNKSFSILGGDVGVYAGMAVAEEFLVIIIYIGLGFALPKLSQAEQGEIGSGKWRQPRERPTRLVSRVRP